MTTRWRMARPAAALREGRTDWYTIRAAVDGGGPARVSIYDEIGYFGVTAKDFIRDLDAVDGDLDLHISSPGGDIIDGVNIYQALMDRPGSVAVTVDSLAASIASVIAMAASPGKLTMAPKATMMIHEGWGMCVGNAKDMTDTAALLDKMSDNIASIYSDRTGKPASQWRNAMREETWYSAQEAVDAGLADKVAPKRGQQDQKALAAAASWDLSVFAHAPRMLVAALGQPYRPQPYKRESWENVQCPHCEKFNDDDAMYCGQCGTKLAGREDVEEDDGDSGSSVGTDAARRQLLAAGMHPDIVERLLNPQPVRARDRVIPMGEPLNADVDHSDWDGPHAMSLAAGSDDPAAAYKQICAGRREGDPSKQASWALPYKYPGKPPNADGVRNALSRLPQTQGLTNEDEARTKLERLMKQINPDYDGGDDRAVTPVLAFDPADFRTAMTLKEAADK